MPARAYIEALLRARKLDVTLTAAGAGLLTEPARPTMTTGLEWLDRQMAGGWPRGESSEIVGPASSGRTAVLCATLAAATARGEIVALVDTLDCFDPQSAAAAGIELSQLLWTRGLYVPSPRMRGKGEGRSAGALDRAIDRAIKAFSLILQAGGFGVVALDLADVPARAIARLPFTTWMRLQRHIQDRTTTALILAPEPVSRSARGVSLRLAVDAATTPLWHGTSDRSRLLAGVVPTASIAASRRLDDARSGSEIGQMFEPAPDQILR
jgi:recombination protein RecA